jgi:hypothetical protein
MKSKQYVQSFAKYDSGNIAIRSENLTPSLFLNFTSMTYIVLLFR